MSSFPPTAFQRLWDGEKAKANADPIAFGIFRTIRAPASSLFLAIHKVFLRKSAIAGTRILSKSALADRIVVCLKGVFSHDKKAGIGAGCSGLGRKRRSRSSPTYHDRRAAAQPLDGGRDPGFRGAVHPGQRPPAPADGLQEEVPPAPLRHQALQEWLDQNYPTEKTPLDELHAQATQEFIREYLRIQPVSAEDYNARRTHPSRGWYAIAKYNHTRRWRILLEKLNLPIYNNRGTPNSVPQLKVRVISDYNFEDENPSD